MLFWYGSSGVVYSFYFIEYALCSKTEGYINLAKNYVD